MSHGFPTEFPSGAVQAVLAPILGRGRIDGQFALGAYELLGFGLYQMFGEVQPMMAAENPDHVANLLAQAPPEVQQAMSFINREGDGMMQAESLPPWMVPFLTQLAQWAIQKALERFSKNPNPTLFGRPIKMETRQLPPPTGGAFPERNLGQPTGTGLFTQTPTQPSPAQQGGPQAQPSDRIQQPTGPAADLHPSTPTSSRSPQFQGNTADPTKQHEPRPATTDTNRGPGLTNAPGVQGNPVVPKESGGQGGQPAQGPQTNLPPANPPATQSGQPPK